MTRDPAPGQRAPGSRTRQYFGADEPGSAAMPQAPEPGEPGDAPNRAELRRRHYPDIDGTWNTRACSINNWPGRRYGVPDPLPVIRMRAAQGHQAARWSARARLLTSTPELSMFDPVTVVMAGAAEIEVSAPGPWPGAAADDDPGGGLVSSSTRRLHAAVLCSPPNGPSALLVSAGGSAMT